MVSNPGSRGKNGEVAFKIWLRNKIVNMDFGVCPDCGAQNVFLRKNGTPDRRRHKCGQNKKTENKTTPKNNNIVCLWITKITKNANSIMVVVVILTLVATWWTLGLTKTEIERKIKIDADVNRGLLESLNAKLDLSLSLAVFFLDNRDDFIDGGLLWSRRFPQDFEEYIDRLGITDEKIIIYLIKLENSNSLINKDIEIFNLGLFSVPIEIDRPHLQHILWGGSEGTMGDIKDFSCELKRLLNEKYGVSFTQPNVNDWVENIERGLEINENIEC